jgi:hypothetical protein
LQNEQCGICWDLKLDKQGELTHNDLKNFHDFVSLDFCVKCNESKYNQWGFQTHSFRTNNLKIIKISKISHEFVSGIEVEYREKQRKNKHIFTFIGIMSIGLTITASLSNLFF